MKIRDSGMPEEAYWETLLDVPLILNQLGVNGTLSDVVELGCGYGTFSLPVARRITGTLTTADIEPEMVRRTANRAAKEGIPNLHCELRDVALLSEEMCDQDRAVGSPRGAVLCPTVIVSSNYARVPMRRPGFNRRNLWHRDGGVCQYTGRKLAPHEGNIDHVVPRSRGGKSTWDNCVLAHKEINSRKADRLPQEAGMRLLKAPVEPKALQSTVLIQNAHGVRDWDYFLG